MHGLKSKKRRHAPFSGLESDENSIESNGNRVEPRVFRTKRLRLGHDSPSKLSPTFGLHEEQQANMNMSGGSIFTTSHMNRQQEIQSFGQSDHGRGNGGQESM